MLWRPPSHHSSSAVAICSILAGCVSPTAPYPMRWEAHDVGSWHIISGAFGLGCFVLGGMEGHAVRSCDRGASWQPVDARLGNARVGALTFAEGMFVAVGDNHLITLSRDAGASWETRVVPFPGEVELSGIARGKRDWVLIGRTPTGSVILRSLDLETFTIEAYPGPPDLLWISVLYVEAHDRYLITGRSERMVQSRSSGPWEEVRLGWHNPPAQCEIAIGCNDIDVATWTGRNYVAVTHPELAVFTSPDLKAWTYRDVPIPEKNIGGFWRIRSADRITMAGGTAGRLALSYDDGVTWVRLDAGFTDGIAAIAAGAKTWVVGGLGGTLRTWTE